MRKLPFTQRHALQLAGLHGIVHPGAAHAHQRRNMDATEIVARTLLGEPGYTVDMKEEIDGCSFLAFGLFRADGGAVAVKWSNTDHYQFWAMEKFRETVRLSPHKEDWLSAREFLLKAARATK